MLLVPTDPMLFDLPKVFVDVPNPELLSKPVDVGESNEPDEPNPPVDVEPNADVLLEDVAFDVVP
jgi:hypothetical protein